MEEPHESAELHVTGEAVYVDDIVIPALTGMVITSPLAHARILSVDLTAARCVPGVHAVLSHCDIPGRNQMGPGAPDEPCLAEGEVQCCGQAVFLVAAETEEACRRAADLVRVQYDPLPAILSIDEAIARNSLLGDVRSVSRGDVESALRSSPHRIDGELRTGAQEHWYLESQVALCVPGEQGTMVVYASSQNPSETQTVVARVLGTSKHRVSVEVRRMGGGFGGKETQANHVACWAATLAHATGRTVKVRLSRDDDMIMTGKRHRFLSRFTVGFDDSGLLRAARFELNSDAGMATDLSHAIMERAMLHCDNAYYFPAMSVTARVWKTHHPSNTAFRGFGGPQGMALVEDVIDRVSRRLRMDPAEVRRRNYYGVNDRNETHYGQVVEHNRLPVIHERLMLSSGYADRRAAIRTYNTQHEFTKRGIAATPVKFGISFTTSFLNQAGALVLVYDDGTILVNHGGTEMGQGVHTKIRQIAAAEFGVRPEQVRVTATTTEKVPNTPPTAASTGTDLNGAAVKNAIDTLKQRIGSALAEVFSGAAGGEATSAADIVFKNDEVFDARHTGRRLPFAEAMAVMRLRQVSLSATGFYRTPGIGWDKQKFTGRPFHYFAFGMAVSEVEVDVLTGRVRVLRTDILHDVGTSVNRGIDLGQIVGGFMQGVGWVTTEEILWSDRGELMTHSPDTYKIPTTQELPLDLRVSILEGFPNPRVIGSSKAVGEPPFMLALSVWLAVKDALSAIAGHEAEPSFGLPATTEVILLSAEQMRHVSTRSS